MSNDQVIGRKCKAYYNSGTHATPTWVEMKKVQDLSVDDLSKNEVQVMDRESEWESSESGHKKAGVSFSYLHAKGADTVFDKLLDSYINDNAVQFAFMDQAIATSGSQGLRAFMEVFQMNQGQEMANAVAYQFQLKHKRFVESSALVNPDWYEVA